MGFDVSGGGGSYADLDFQHCLAPLGPKSTPKGLVYPSFGPPTGGAAKRPSYYFVCGDIFCLEGRKRWDLCRISNPRRGRQKNRKVNLLVSIWGPGGPHSAKNKTSSPRMVVKMFM